jgi:deoxyribonuclease V
LTSPSPSSSSSPLYSSTVSIQKEIAKRVIAKDSFDMEIKHVCGADVSYKDNIAYCSAALINKNTLRLIESVNTKDAVKHPYIPGLLMLRESEPIMNTLKLLKGHFELLLIDGHGQLHPRRGGLACYIGVILNKPTIGVAKSLLCGSLRGDQFVELNREILGFRIKKEGMKKQIYVSVGHNISLDSAIKIVKQLVKNGEWMPEPLRIADINSKNYFNFA